MKLPRGRRFLLFVFLISVLYITGTAVFGERGLLAVFAMESDAATLNAEVYELQAEIDARQREVQALRKNDTAVERIAREEHGYVRPDEVIYQFPEEDEGKQ